MAQVQRKRPRKAAANVSNGPKTRWGMLLVLTLSVAGATGYMRMKAAENLEQVRQEELAIAAMERAYGGGPTRRPQPVAEVAAGDSPVSLQPQPRSIPRPPPGWRSEFVLQPNCRASSTPSVQTAAAPMYRWRDSQGSLQFGRSPPDGVAAIKVIENDRNRAQFKLAVGEGDGSPVPTQLRDRATADTYRIVAILRQELGIPVDDDFTLNLSFVSRSEDVGRDLGLTGAAGVYLPNQQRMIVWRQPNDGRTFATVRHESVHALLHEFVGAPPTWLNEGLAEYVETLRVSGSGGSVAANQHHRQLLQPMLKISRTEAALKLLDANANQFREADKRDTNYALAWALVHYLMGSESGQRVFAELLGEVREAGCQPFSSRAFLERKFTGGAREFVRKAVSSNSDRRHHY